MDIGFMVVTYFISLQPHFFPDHSHFSFVQNASKAHLYIDKDIN